MLTNYKLISYILFLAIISVIICKNKTFHRAKVSDPKGTNYTSYFQNSTVNTTTEGNFDKYIMRNNTHDFLILFTVRKCYACNKMIKLMEDLKDYYSQKTNELDFFKIDCFENKWMAMRFGLERVPNLIYVSNGLYSIYPYKNYSLELAKEFIENEKKTYKAIPEQFSTFSLLVKIFHFFNDYISTKVPHWNEGFGFIAVIVIFFLFFFFQNFLYRLCCGRFLGKKKGKEKDKKDSKKVSGKKKSKSEEKDSDKEKED